MITEWLFSLKLSQYSSLPDQIPLLRMKYLVSYVNHRDYYCTTHPPKYLTIMTLSGAFKTTESIISVKIHRSYNSILSDDRRNMWTYI